MGFEGLLGNHRLKENLQLSIRRNRLSHFYLISGPEGSGKKTLARLLAAAIHCRGQEKPCLSCPACRKVMQNTHPDLITVVDPEHKNVAVKIVREMREDMFIRPNESDRKIYVFPQSLGIEGQNALLKILEEPPAYGVFLLLADNPETLLPTIRSRCTELKLVGLEEPILRQTLQKDHPEASPEEISGAIARSGGFLGQARALLEADALFAPQTQAFLNAFSQKNSLELVRTLAPMEKLKRDQFVPVLEQWVQVLENALLCHNGVPASYAGARQVSASRGSRELMGAIEEIKKCIEYAQGNVSVAAICGHLQWALR